MDCGGMGPPGAGGRGPPGAAIDCGGRGPPGAGGRGAWLPGPGAWPLTGGFMVGGKLGECLPLTPFMSPPGVSPFTGP